MAVSELEGFYASAMGAVAQEALSTKLTQAWGTAEHLRVAGFGYTQPYLGVFTGAERMVAMSPAGAGIRAGGDVPAALVSECAWPLPDASIDRLLILHGMEESSDARRLLREAWRVLADDGLMIIAVANRRGPWAMVETSPFAAGQPYSRRQLDDALKAAMFGPTAHATALHFPPIRNKALLRLAPTWERLGATIEDWRLPPIFPNLAGVNLVEARKVSALPISGSKAEVFRPGLLMPGRLGKASPANRVKKVRK
ncbi:class I SAM-dependent methyltransferase [Parvularcula marina]|uniref:class I SAM-dependent methyltransferase n=1 Tax=Parvularcula marina TaxID=2292771 RepID=UPI003512B225